MGSPSSNYRGFSSNRRNTRTPSREPPPLSPESQRQRSSRQSRVRSRSRIFRTRSRTPPRTPSRTRSSVILSIRNRPVTRTLATPKRESRSDQRRRCSSSKRHSFKNRSRTPHHYRRGSRNRHSRSDYRRERSNRRRRCSSSADEPEYKKRHLSRNRSPARMAQLSRSDSSKLGPSDSREVTNSCSLYSPSKDKTSDVHIEEKSVLDTGKSNENSLLEKLVTALTERGSSTVQGTGMHAAQNVLPDFNPQGKVQTMKEWLAKIDESAHVYGWSERQTIFYALPKLRGLAKRWYDGLTSIKYTWAEWREKLITAFPCEQNYADILSEMLARKTRRNETLEEYYYDKIMLINRCEFNGRKAVDCLTQGIYDANIRMNVQGANLQSPESVLQYFRNITSKAYAPRSFNQNQQPFEHNNKRNNDPSSRKPTTMSQTTCYNCGEVGHIVTRCPKDVLKCNKCRRYGHDEKNCTGQFDPRTAKDTVSKVSVTNNSKNVLNIVTAGRGSEKYFKPITVNGKSMTSFVDLGSQCTLLREDFGLDLKLSVDKSNLPMLKGFASGVLVPSGRVNIRVTLDGLDENIEAYLVESSALPADVLVGQSLTELPQVRALKTNDKLVFYKDIGSKYDKQPISNTADVRIHGAVTIEVTMPFEITGLVYIDTEPCMREGKEYMILPGLYSISSGKGYVVVIPLNSEPFILRKGILLARGLVLSNIMPISEPQTNNSMTINSITANDNTSPKTIEPEQINMNSSLAQDVKDQLCNLLHEYRNCFAFSLEELGKTECTEMRIELKDHVPVTYRPYRLSLSERDKVNNIINNLLANGIIQESTSEYASPIILVAKKTGIKTVREKFPMPLIDDQIDSLSGQVFFTTLDLTSGYHQVPMAKESKHLTAFVTPDGHYEYNRMPFGLTNAPAVFQRLILKLLKTRRIPGVLAYMDDIIIASKTIPEGMSKLREVLDLLIEANLTLNLAKCNFFQNKIQYLGFEISSEGVRPGEEKTKAVSNFKTPKNVHEVRQFIGLSSFFRRFVQGFATIARPLTILTKAATPWVWGNEQDQAFSKLKEILTTRPVLAIYNPEFDTELHTDASATGLGGILLQRSSKDSPLRPVAYFSRQTTAEEQRFHSYELETLAVVSSLNRFRVYLLGIDFKIVTDCNALRTTLTKRDLIPRIARWWLLVQEFSFTVEYKPGSQMAHADALSRNSVPEQEEHLSIMQIGEVNWLQSVQMSDPRLCHIKAVLDTKSQEAKDIRVNYELKDGKIYRKVNGELRWAVPRDARWKIMQQCHDEAGHFAYEKTLEKVRRDYWFPKLAQFTKKYVRACIPCAHAKVPGGKKQGFLHPIPKPNSPFQCLHIDHLGPFIKSKRGNLYVLGIIDSFTKFIILRAVKNTKSKTSISVLRDVFALFGIPSQVISDRGTSFTSNEFKMYIESIGVKHTLNAVATPRANGQIERYNRSILTSLVALCHNEDDRDWDVKLGQVQWSLNNTVNQGTGKCPSEIIFGRPTVNTVEAHLHEINTEEASIESVDRIREEVRTNIQDRQDKMKTRYDKKRSKVRTYKEGDLVMAQKNTKTPGESHKLVPAFSGPYRVTAVLGHDRYEISSVEGYSKKKYSNVFSVDKLKPWMRFGDTDSESDYGDSE
ncbi:hypothetical protein ABMA27_014141 [Loxostege sticticalis]|uniref:RNA-directed DNA polymerase n=1 Tax=Loxostege sticticalis TaxID=481309 RepID=A0ABR3ICV7_LOXSC